VNSRFHTGAIIGFRVVIVKHRRKRVVA
jgi:hypothetical protein